METRSLEIKVTSAKGLKKVSKMDVFVAAKLSGDPKCSHHLEQRTQVVRDSGTSPRWSSDVMKFSIDQTLAEANRLVITFKIKCEQRGGGDKDIGEIHVLVKELLDHLGNDKTGQRYVTYQMKEPNGKLRGDISFTYSFAGDPVIVTSGGSYSMYPAHEPVRPGVTCQDSYSNYPTQEPVRPAATYQNSYSQYPIHKPVRPVVTFQPDSNRPVLSQLLPSVGSFSYNHVPSQPPVYSPLAQPETGCFPGFSLPHGYQLSHIPESPSTMYSSIFPGLSYPPETYPPETYPPVIPPHTQPGLYPPMNHYSF